MFSALVSGRLVDTMVAEVKCAYMDWLAPYLCLLTISHKKNVSRVPRAKKKDTSPLINPHCSKVGSRRYPHFTDEVTEVRFVSAT